jgi:superfamily II DNA or RNA helicase
VIIWLIAMWHKGKRALIICPRTNLVLQACDDFQKFAKGAKVAYSMQYIMEGQEKKVQSDIVVTTYQSILSMDKKRFRQFGVIIVDEAHQYESKCLKGIMEKADQVAYRFGLSGSLTGTLINESVLEGLFGRKRVVGKTMELVKEGYIARPVINCCVLEFPEKDAYALRKLKNELPNKGSARYAVEIDFLNNHYGRNIFIKKLVLSLDRNRLILFDRQEHGEYLYEMLKRCEQHVDLVYGPTETDQREMLRKLTEIRKKAIILASFGVFSTGVSINNLHHIILAQMTKSRVRILQSIGRGLRMGENKTECGVWDLIDDLAYAGKSNYSIAHFRERASNYDEQEFDYKVKTYRIGVADAGSLQY